MAPRLSQSRDGDDIGWNPSSCRREDNHIVSDVALASALYSIYVDDRAITRCFLELQETGLEPRKLIYAEVEM